MNTLCRTLSLIVLVAVLISCNEQGDMSNPATAGDAALDNSGLTKKPVQPPAPSSKIPVITSISVSQAEIGDEITIEGSNFGTKYTVLKNYVTIHGIPAYPGIAAYIYPSWGKTEIKVLVPSGSLSSDGKVQVVLGSVLSNEADLTISPSTQIKIGNQTWAGSNLDVTKYVDGADILHAQTDQQWQDAGADGVGAWCYYEGDSDMGILFGKLYNWYAVNNTTNGGLAPAGQHIPTDDEWKTLSKELGMTQAQADGSGGYFGTAEGGMLKEAGTSLWCIPNSGRRSSPNGKRALKKGSPSSRRSIWRGNRRTIAEDRSWKPLRRI